MRIGRKGKIAAALAGLVILLVAGVDYWGGFQRLEALTYDARLQWARADSAPHPDIVVILIDEASLKAMNPLVGRYPWPRSVYADLIEFLRMGGARAVVFDILFSEHQKEAKGAGANDERLKEATRQTEGVFHAAQVFRNPEDFPAAKGSDGDLALPGQIGSSCDGCEALPGPGRLLPPFPGLAGVSHGLGVVSLTADRDGAYRKVRPLFLTQRGIFPALGLAPWMEPVGEGSPEIRWREDALRVGEQRIPLAADGRVWVNMVGDFPAYSASGVFASVQGLRRGKAADLPVYPDEFSGKIVFVGASATGLEDIKTTGLSNRTPGVYIHASLASNFLTGDFLASVPKALTLSLVAILALATMALVVGSGRLWAQAGGPLALGVGYALWGFWRFEAGWVYELTPPLVALGLSWLGGSAFLAVTEGREKRRVRRMFSQYVSPPVLAELMARPGDHLTAEVGTTENLTVLFSDIRGFTGISEDLPPEQVVELLNEYLGAMSRVILAEKGTLDKFVGDAIMAFWGAPVHQPDHAERGVRAAFAMARCLEDVNESLRQKGYPAIQIGTGIHTAPVILGNIGSEQKLDYTVIGDNVNLASRLEGLTKLYGCPLLISGDTRAALPAGLPCGIIDRVQVKGREAPTTLYWPLCLPEDSPDRQEWARDIERRLEAAFQAYLERDWQRAEARYGDLPADWSLRQVFLDRCQSFREHPPGEEWDGVYRHQEK